ncbi:hypothetical protein MPP7335_05822 [Mycolicibacterium parafortuitum]|uniref:Uncharacterized protein n=1 Tax=Mycolicibacterium parafortuitum TaxID=39692 RepID=A0A375YSG2_MYCPF|nr:hypothetical protein MPP7335_05822 [Mycolicibacterium parafortuitum]
MTGISVPSVALTAAATIWPNSLRLYGSAAPPPRRVTFGTGQPKFMSMWSARFSSTIIFAAAYVLTGSTV